MGSSTGETSVSLAQSADVMPAFIEWRAEFELGLPEMDAQHRGLMALVNRVADCFLNPAKENPCLDAMGALLSGTRAHFRWEESLMAAHGYAGLSAHREQHSELLASMERLERDFRIRAHVINKPTTLKFLRDWFVLHIQHSDAAFVRAYESAAGEAK
jgi:hemerythrin